MAQDESMAVVPVARTASPSHFLSPLYDVFTLVLFFLFFQRRAVNRFRTESRHQSNRRWRRASLHLAADGQSPKTDRFFSMGATRRWMNFRCSHSVSLQLAWGYRKKCPLFFYFDFDCQTAHSVAELIGRAHSIDTNQLDAVVDSNR